MVHIGREIQPVIEEFRAKKVQVGAGRSRR